MVKFKLAMDRVFPPSVFLNLLLEMNRNLINTTIWKAQKLNTVDHH